MAAAEFFGPLTRKYNLREIQTFKRAFYVSIWIFYWRVKDLRSLCTEKQQFIKVCMGRVLISPDVYFLAAFKEEKRGVKLHISVHESAKLHMVTAGIWRKSHIVNSDILQES